MRLKKLLLFGFVLIVLTSIPVTVFFLRQQTQQNTHAAAATILSFTPTNSSVAVGDTFNMDVSVNPGTNQLSLIKLQINYDSSKLTPVAATSCPVQTGSPVCPNAVAFPTILEGPTVTDGSILVTLSIGSDPTKVIQTPTKVATITFQAKSPTGTTPIQVTFGNQSQALSIASADQSNENVLSSSQQSTVTITSATSTTPAPTNTAPTAIPATVTSTPTSITPTTAITPSITINPTAVPTVITTPQPSIAPTGSNTTVIFGIFGILLAVTGGFIFAKP